MWQEIGNLFTTSKIIAVLFILAGLAMCGVEILRVKASNIGLLGGALTIASAMALMMVGGTFTQLIFLAIVSMIIIVVLFCIHTIISEGGISFKRTPKIKVDAEEVDEEATLKRLLGKTGVAHSDVDPTGKVVINGVTLDATTFGDKIEKNTKVKIVKIDGVNIYVKGIEEVDE